VETRLCSQTGFRELWAGRRPLERLTRLPKIGPKGDLSGYATDQALAKTCEKRVIQTISFDEKSMTELLTPDWQQPRPSPADVQKMWTHVQA